MLKVCRPFPPLSRARLARPGEGGALLLPPTMLRDPRLHLPRSTWPCSSLATDDEGLATFMRVVLQVLTVTPHPHFAQTHET